MSSHKPQEFGDIMSSVRVCRPLELCSLPFAVCMVFVMFAAPAAADTIYLKNGAFIDGMVGYRSTTFLELEIGKIGKLHISLDDIFVIEKNNRTGEDLAQAYVDPEGEREILPTGKNSGDSDDPDESGELSDDDYDSDDGRKSPRASRRNSRDDDGRSDDDSYDVDVISHLVDEEEIDPKLERRIKDLVKDLERQKARYRVRAERHLKTIGQPAVPFLIPLTENKNDLTRIATMRLFLSFGDDRVVDSCIELLTDVNEYVRDYANKTLERVTGEDFGFVSYASPRKRTLVQKKWAKWWKKELADLAKNFRSSRGDDE